MNNGFPIFWLLINIFGTGFDSLQTKLVARAFDSDYSFMAKLKGHAAGLGHATAVFTKGGADFGVGAVLIIGGNLHNYGHATRTITLVSNFFQYRGVFISRSLDRT